MTKRSLIASTMLFAAISKGAFAEVSLSGILTDVEDGNRFFTRLGGEAQENLTLTGLIEGVDYVLTTALIDAVSEEEVDSAETTFTAESTEMDLSVNLLVPRNEGDLNIDYITRNTLRTVDVKAALIDVKGEAADPARGIQVHSIQRMNVISVADASDGNDRLHSDGGKVEVTVDTPSQAGPGGIFHGILGSTEFAMNHLPGQPRDEVVAQLVGQAGIKPIGHPATLRAAGKILDRRAQTEIDVCPALG